MTTNNDMYNADELEAPAWLNEQFFQDALIQYLKEPNLKVTEAKMSPASAKGDHYASVMFRAIVEYSTQKRKCSKSLIIKTMPEVQGKKKDFLADSHIFETEIIMYTQVLPKFEAILREAGEEIKFCGTCVYYSLEPREVMIFEDLVPQGYQVIRNRDLTMDELRAAMEKLAKWHAVSHKVLKEQPILFDKLKYDLATLPGFLEDDFLTSGLPNFIDMLGQNESLRDYCKYFEPMRNKLLNLWADIIHEYRENRQENTYYVLCHGDFHMKNMMFKGNDCMLLDFQLSYVGCMSNDVQYAKYMLFSAEDRKDKCDELIYHYFDVFAKTLKKIGCELKKHSLVEFRRQMFDRRNTEFMLLTTFLPIFNSMRMGHDPGTVLENAGCRAELFANKDYRNELEYLLPRMLHSGYFEAPTK
ncbi:uncharacterized protein LOC6568355 [Drosophila grimshawi]|uniref:GH17369 n=1 Tax=Drosophila grimshawi TaxID=7222 RepID=B4JUY3_DROGR|nr:uncharacterized protein LOC6568355 [Drosophila grimshawi]EDV91303.1 GH17369 [Drosophila grimshawi]